MTDNAQSDKFIEKARELGCDEDEAAFDRAVRHLAKPSTPTTPKQRGTKKRAEKKRR